METSLQTLNFNARAQQQEHIQCQSTARRRNPRKSGNERTSLDIERLYIQLSTVAMG